MSSTEVANVNNPSPAGFSQGVHKGSAMTHATHAQQAYTATPAAEATKTTAPLVEDKRFTTAYGMVVWPSLPGLSSSSSLPAPVAAAGTPTRPENVGLVHHHNASSVEMVNTTPGTARSLLPGTVAEHSHGFNDGGERLMSQQLYSANSTMLLRAACDACHRMKRKCDGKQPCTRCERRSRECFYSYKQKSGPPKGSKRKLIEEEDDLPENRAMKPLLGHHAQVGGIGSDGGRPFSAAGAAAAPSTTWREGDSSSGSNNTYSHNGMTSAGGDGGGGSRNHHDSSSPTPIETTQRFSQLPAQPYSHQALAQQSALETSPAPAPQTSSMPSQRFDQVSSPQTGPSPEARAAAAAAVAASRIKALPPLPPALAAVGLHPSYILQHPPTLPGLSGGGGGGGGGSGGSGGSGSIGANGAVVPATAPMVAQPQYGMLYQHQYPPEVYAVYLAELRQRTCGGGTINTNNINANGMINGGNSSNNQYANHSSTPSTTTSTAPVFHNSEAQRPLAAATLAKTARPAEGVSPGKEASATAPAQLVGTSGVPLLPGIGGGWPGGIVSEGSSVSGGGRSGEGGGMKPDAINDANVAKMSTEGGQGGHCEYGGNAAAAATSSVALAAAVAAAIADSSPEDGGGGKNSSGAMLYSAVTPYGDQNNDAKVNSGGGGSGNGVGGGGGSSGGVCVGAGVDGTTHAGPKAPLSAVKQNFFGFSAPGGAGGTATAAVPQKMAGLADGATPSAPADASTERGNTELAAASLLLCGSKGSGGDGGGGTSRTVGVDFEKGGGGQMNPHQRGSIPN